MAVFLSTFINKVDRKGRVSVPSSFRSELAREADPNLVVFPSLQWPALECCSRAWIENFSTHLDHMDMPPEDKDIIATTIFGHSVPLSLDAEGRILLPTDLVTFAKLDEQAAFFGCGATFQIWEPSALHLRTEQSRQQARSRNMSLRLITPTPINKRGADDR